LDLTTTLKDMVTSTPVPSNKQEQSRPDVDSTKAESNSNMLNELGKAIKRR
jgi:hypothetical protein